MRVLAPLSQWMHRKSLTFRLELEPPGSLLNPERLAQPWISLELRDRERCFHFINNAQGAELTCPRSRCTRLILILTLLDGGIPEWEGLKRLISEADLNLVRLKEAGRKQTQQFRSGNAETGVQDRN